MPLSAEYNIIIALYSAVNCPCDGPCGPWGRSHGSILGRQKEPSHQRTKENTFCREQYVQSLYTKATIRLEVTYELDKDY